MHLCQSALMSCKLAKEGADSTQLDKHENKKITLIPRKGHGKHNTGLCVGGPHIILSKRM